MIRKERILKDCIPKKATQQEEFLKKYPEYDGRGVKIAIIDNPIDVSMPGLQKTTTGLPKILDCYSFAQYGKINTSSIREVDSDNILIGLTGRKLEIPLTWKNPSGKWHLGFVDYYNMFFNKLSIEKKKEENDTEKLEESFNRALKINESNKKVAIDFIVWHDGQKWQACLTTSEMNLENAKVLTNFCDEHEFGFINNNSYCITINENGNFINVFSQMDDKYRDHGTVVATVAAGNFFNESYPNGLAPGAQIISMDPSYEACAIKKALLKCIELKVDIINISLGFRYSPSTAKVIKKAAEQYGILIFYAAPNEGPLYSSINEDESCAYDQLFNVGSIMPFEIRCQLNDGKEEEEPSKLCLNSAMGPSITGGKGIDFTAPGVIISTYPYRSPSKKGRYLGTSLAAPNVAGSVACLLSALKANSIQYSPATIKLALSNTAYLPESGDQLGFGNGIIQINSAFEYLKTVSKTLSKHFQIPKLTLFESKKKSTVNHINLIQKDCDEFGKKYCVKINEINNDEISWILKITPGGEKFVKYSDTVTDGMFTVNINTDLLNPGSLNFAEIHGFNSTNISFGPLFKFPITVIIPKFTTKEEENSMQKEIVLCREIPNNIFLHSPCEYSKYIVKLTALEEMTEKIYFQYSVKKIKNGNIRDTKVCRFTPKRNWIIFSIPAVLYNQIFGISIFRYNYYKRIPENLKFNFEIIFQKSPKRNI